MSIIKRIYEFAEELQDLPYEEFENLVIDILKNNNKFSQPVKSKAGTDRGYDLFADESVDKARSVRSVFQLKRTNLVTDDYINHIAEYWKSRGWPEATKLYIVTEGIVTEQSKESAFKSGIEIWDIYKLYSLVTEELKDKYFYSGIKKDPFQETREHDLSDSLQRLPKGKTNWGAYQKLCGDILSHLFVPPLNPPRYEHSDEDGKNRRDIIFENSSEHPFWKYVRETYRGFYIVADAKNYTDPINKQPILDIAHYLKPYGCGMFGVLLTRVGTDDAGRHAIKEQWIGNGKMIVVFSDNDILEMLKMKQANDKPEEIIRMKIADFRMGL